MKTTLFIKSLLLALCIALSVCLSAQAQPSAFTYQGKLTDGSGAANGQYDFTFRLFDAAQNGTQFGTDAVLDNVPVSGGIFSVTLDFGVNSFSNGSARFLEISVRAGASTGAFTLLAPRQQITSAPFAIKSLSATNADSLSNVCVLCVTDAQIQTVDGNKVTGTVANATTAANISGIVPITNGGTGSSTKNFADLSTNQTILGNKTFPQTTNLSFANIGTLNLNASATFNGSATFNNANPVTISGALNVGGGITAEQFIGSGEALTNVPGTFKWQSVSGLSQQAQPNNGYLAINDAQVTVTLPANLFVGETVRISGAGSGGWKILANPGQSIIGNGFTTASGWTAHESNREWTDVASSADGTKLVAVAGIFVDQRIYTSSDSGTTWTPRESPRLWSSVASSSDGSKIIASAFGGQIYTSTDFGVTWVPKLTAQNWFSVASSADGSKLAAVSDFDGLFISTNSGVTWIQRSVPLCVSFVEWSANGTTLAATGKCIGDGVYTSTDSGATWTLRLAGGDRGFRNVVMSDDGAKLAASTGDSPERVYTSADSGATWTLRGSFGNVLASSADGSKLVSIIFNGRIATSSDFGATWIVRGVAAPWSAAASSSDGIKIVAVVRNGQIYTFDSTLPSGITQLSGQQHSAIELQYVGNGRFMALSHEGNITGLSF